MQIQKLKDYQNVPLTLTTPLQWFLLLELLPGWVELGLGTVCIYPFLLSHFCYHVLLFMKYYNLRNMIHHFLSIPTYQIKDF